MAGKKQHNNWFEMPVDEVDMGDCLKVGMSEKKLPIYWNELVSGETRCTEGVFHLRVPV